MILERRGVVVMRAMTEASLVDAVIQKDDGCLQAAVDAVSAIICDNRSMFTFPPRKD